MCTERVILTLPNTVKTTHSVHKMKICIEWVILGGGTLIFCTFSSRLPLPAFWGGAEKIVCIFLHIPAPPESGSPHRSTAVLGLVSRWVLTVTLAHFRMARFVAEFSHMCVQRSRNECTFTGATQNSLTHCVFTHALTHRI